jgi:hypothetical protein
MHGIWNIPTFFICWTKLHDATQNVVGSVPDYLWKSRRFPVSESHFFPHILFFFSGLNLFPRRSYPWCSGMNWQHGILEFCWYDDGISAQRQFNCPCFCKMLLIARHIVHRSTVPKSLNATAQLPQRWGQHVPHHEVPTFTRFSAVSSCFLVSHLTMPSITEIT